LREREEIMNRKLQEIIVATIPDEEEQPGRGIAVIAAIGGLVVGCLIILALWPGV
jgi:LPS O-antigen subunit length determinant protein (WzzB/FepE family)